LLGLDRTGLAELAKAAVTASFAPEPVKRLLLGEIANYLTSAG